MREEPTVEEVKAVALECLPGWEWIFEGLVSKGLWAERAKYYTAEDMRRIYEFAKVNMPGEQWVDRLRRVVEHTRPGSDSGISSRVWRSQLALRTMSVCPTKVLKFIGDLYADGYRGYDSRRTR